MLTAKNVSAKKATEYFLQGYYQEGKSRWFGIGAEKLGLAGAIDNEEIFNNIVQGRSPDGKQQLCTRKTQAEQRRAALDCTFEAPKSVSLTALPGGDERLVEAHAIAVESALALIEQRCAHTRVSIDKQRLTVNTGNLVVAQFDHIESRELDPHLHTHCLLMNMVQTVDGKWYSHLNDAIFHHKKYWGMVYQHFLAAEVQKLGYEIEWRGHGQFELKGYTLEELKEFSKRRQQILAVVGANSTWAEREAAWKATRSRKEEVKPEELLAGWREETELFGIQFVQPKQAQDVQQPQRAKAHQLLDDGERQQTIAEQLDSEQQPREIAQLLLDDAIRHCEQRQVIFALEDLEKFVLSAGILVDPKQLEPLFQQHQELTRLELKEGVRYTTQEAVWRDRATVHLMRSGQEAVSAIAQPEMVIDHLLLTKLNAGQRSAVELAATTTDRFIVWQGVAGAGKTWALQELKAIAEAQGYTVKGFGITTDAENELKTKAGIQATTVASLLVSKQPEQPQPNQLWIVDEAGMLSAKQCYGLMQRAASEGARVVLVGDVRQFSAVEAGNPFKLLQAEGIKTAHMEESLRQRHNPELKIAIDLIAQGKIEQGFARLDQSKRIISCDDSNELTRGITAEYLKIAPEKRIDSLVLAGTHKQRLEITGAIRDALKAEGSLGTAEVLLKSLVQWGRNESSVYTTSGRP